MSSRYAYNFDIFNLYSAFQSSILNVILAEGICDTRVSACGNLCFAPLIVSFALEMLRYDAFEKVLAIKVMIVGLTI